MAGFEADIKKEEFLMKKPVLVALIIALVCGMAMIGCSSDDGGGGGGGGGGAKAPGLLGNVAPSDLPNVDDVDNVASQGDAETLIGAVASTLVTKLTTGNVSAFTANFKEKVVGADVDNVSGFITAHRTATSKSVSFNTSFTKEDTGMKTTLGSETAATLVGSSRGSWSSSVALASTNFDPDGEDAKKGDTQTVTSSTDKTVTFGIGDDGTKFVVITDDKYEVAGVIKVVRSSTGTKTISTPPQFNDDDDLIAIAQLDTDSTYTDQLAVALTVSNITDGEEVWAKFLFAYSVDSTNDKARAIESTGGTSYSDVEVWGLDDAGKDKQLFTIKNGNAQSIINQFRGILNALTDAGGIAGIAW
jgi:hypothetical protein